MKPEVFVGSKGMLCLFPLKFRQVEHSRGSAEHIWNGHIWNGASPAPAGSSADTDRALGWDIWAELLQCQDLWGTGGNQEFIPLAARGIEVSFKAEEPQPWERKCWAGMWRTWSLAPNLSFSSALSQGNVLRIYSLLPFYSRAVFTN